jgi:2-methylisocitrate lyase-like PEP mutase family enzyme
MKQNAKAQLFRKLHDRSSILVLPNAWDVASARLFEEAGFPAIGTTSAGIAASLGYADHERISRGEMAKAVARIAEAVRVPVTADMEGGYGPIARAVSQTALAAIEAGAVGINLEDANRGDRVRPLLEIEVQADRIHHAREAARKEGVELFINARTDVYLVEFGAESARLDRAVRRAKAYLEAGADGIFVPGVRDRGEIQALAKAIPAPLNVLAGPGTPTAAELQALGVARVSMGSGPMRAALAATRRLATELRDRGAWAGFTQDALSHEELNALLERRAVKPAPDQKS